MLVSLGCRRILTTLVLTSTALSARPAQAEIGDSIADGVIGQSRFTDSVALPIGPNGFGVPKGVAIDRSVTPNRVYVADSVYHRVLGWADVDALSNGAPADIVMGSPTSRAARPTRASAARLASPSRPSTTIPSRSPTPGTIACSSSTRRSASTTTN